MASERVVVYDTGTPTALQNFTAIGLPAYTVTVAKTSAQTWSATNNFGCCIYITNESGGPQPAVSDGTNYRRFTDRAIIS